MFSLSVVSESLIDSIVGDTNEEAMNGPAPWLGSR